jgi:hypothetical protein
MMADNPTNKRTIPSVSLTTARTGASTKANAMGMRPMQERVYARRGEQYLLIKSLRLQASRGRLCSLRSTNWPTRGSSR